MRNHDHYNEQDGLEAFFTKHLRDASMAPSARPWEGIEQALELERKRKKRFFWIFFSGIGFVAAFVTLYLCLPGTRQPNAGSTAAIVKIKPLRAMQSHHVTLNSTSTASKEKRAEKPLAKAPEPPATVAPAILKIQLGAFKKPVNTSVFKKLGFPVVAEKSADGFTRYMAEVPGDHAAALEILRQAGFRDAFIKTDSGGSSGNTHPAATQLIAGAKAQRSPGRQANAQGTILSKAIPEGHGNTGVISGLPVNNSAGHAGGHHNPPAQGDKGLQKIAAAQNTVGAQQSAPLQHAGIAQQMATEPAGQGQPSERIKSTGPDSSSTIEQSPLATDSTEKLPAIADSTASLKPAKASDSIAGTNPAAKWSLALTGGPNVFFNTVRSSLFNPSGEKQPLAYGGAITAGYRASKAFSFSAGIGYSYYITRQDATYFRFSKHLTSDYTFYTSQGPVNVSKDVMLDGFSTLAPIDTFAAHYSYTARMSLINIPLRANWHFMNAKKFSLYAGLGLNLSYAASQYTQLDVIKEHVTNHVESRHVYAHKFNTALLLGLGCDVRIRKRWFLTLAPSYTYGINNVSGTPGVLFRPNYFSGQAGLKIVF